MKKIIIAVFLFLTLSQVHAQLTEKITLPEPVKTGGMPLMEALSKRSSSREFDATKSLSKQELSNLLWAAFGFNRDDKRTAPSSHNMQEIEIYVFTKQGVYLWDAKANVLHSIYSEDMRVKTGKQDFVEKASVNLVYVSDYSKMTKIEKEEDKAINTATNAGHISQNVYLYSASKGYSVVVRGWFDKAGLASLLKLDSNKHVVLTQSVGY